MDHNQENKQHFERPTIKKQFFPGARLTTHFAIVLIVSLIAGAVGFSVMSSLYPSLVGYDWTQQGSTSRLVIDAGSTKTMDFLDLTEQYIALIYLNKAGTDTDPFKSINAVVDYRGSAVVVTSDGWLSYPGKLLGQPAAYDAVIQGIHNDVESIYFDAYTSTSFIKVEASGLKAVDFHISAPEQGSQIFFNKGVAHQYPSFGNANVGSVPSYLAAGKDAYLLDSGQYNSGVEVVTSYTIEQLSSTISFYENGTFAGNILAKGSRLEMVSAREVKLSLEQLLNDQENTGLGISYYDGFVLEGANAESKGAVVYNRYRSAVAPNSIAAEIGLLEGDVIIAINGELITQADPLDYLWRRHQYDSLQVQIERAGKLETLQLTK